MLFPLYCLNCPRKISHFLSQIDGLVSAYPCGYALRNSFSERFCLSCFRGSSRSFQRSLFLNDLSFVKAYLHMQWIDSCNRDIVAICLLQPNFFRKERDNFAKDLGRYNQLTILIQLLRNRSQITFPFVFESIESLQILDSKI